MAEYRDYTFLGTTQSLCPQCLQVVPAKVIERNGRVYFRKTCREHGVREDFVCSDVSWFDRREYILPGKVPRLFGVEPTRGCPFDCGLCTEHEQHTCIGLLEITSNCNLKCPMCFAGSGPGGAHLTFEQCQNAINRLVEVEGRAEVLQLSGGEPTIHPQFAEIHRYACERPVDLVMINTNGVRLANDDAFLERVAQWRHRTEIYLQFDGFTEVSSDVLRGESLVETKLRAVDRLGQAGLNTILVCTVQAALNLSEVGAIVQFGMERPWVTGVSFQPAVYTGRHVLPDELEQRITFPDVLQAVQDQTGGVWKETDFSPLPCAHPNAHTLAYAFRSSGVYPLARFVDLQNHLDLLSGRITFDRQRARSLITEYLSRQFCGTADCTDVISRKIAQQAAGLTEDEISAAGRFFQMAVQETLSPADMFRITTTSFMDAYNFDIRQLMKSCVHFILPTGHIIPFSAYNVLYREGHVPLPDLTRQEVSLC